VNSVDPKDAMRIAESRVKPSASEVIRDCVSKLLLDIDHGKEWPTTWFEAELKIERNRASFGMAMSEVNAQLERRGYHLTSRGKFGQSYFVEPLQRTVGIVKMMNRRALKYLGRSAVFAHNVVVHHGDKLTESERRQIEKRAEVQAIRYALASRLR